MFEIRKARQEKGRGTSQKCVPTRSMGTSNMEPYWVPGVNNLGQYGRWSFAEFTEVYQIEAGFKAKVEVEFNKMIEQITPKKV